MPPKTKKTLLFSKEEKKTLTDLKTVVDEWTQKRGWEWIDEKYRGDEELQLEEKKYADLPLSEEIDKNSETMKEWFQKNPQHIVTRAWKSGVCRGVLEPFQFLDAAKVEQGTVSYCHDPTTGKWMAFVISFDSLKAPLWSPNFPKSVGKTRKTKEVSIWCSTPGSGAGTAALARAVSQTNPALFPVWFQSTSDDTKAKGTSSYRVTQLKWIQGKVKSEKDRRNLVGFYFWLTNMKLPPFLAAVKKELQKADAELKKNPHRDLTQPQERKGGEEKGERQVPFTGKDYETWKKNFLDTVTPQTKKQVHKIQSSRSGSGGKKGSTGEKKQRRKKKHDNFKNFMYKVLKVIHPDLGLSGPAVSIVNSFILDMLDRLASEAAIALKVRKGQTLQPKDFKMACRFVLSGELVKHAIAEGGRAVIKYSDSLSKPSNLAANTAKGKKGQTGKTEKGKKK